MSVNRVCISGNLTRDSEMRTTPGGMNILNFGMAVNDRRKNNQTGEWENVPNFVDCVLFGNRAEWLSHDLHKGKKVYVEGKLRYSSWEKDGQKRSKLEVVVDEIDYERPPRQQGQQPRQQPQQMPQQPAPQPMQQMPMQQPQQMPMQQPMQQMPQQGGYQPNGGYQPDVYSEDIPF